METPYLDAIIKMENIEQYFDYMVRYNNLLIFFMHLSHQNKTKFVHKLIENVRCKDSLMVILNIAVQSSKLINIKKTLVDVDFPYDQILRDHDRMMSVEIVKQEMQLELNWFREMPSQVQEKLLITLMRVAGSAITENMFRFCKLEYEKKCGVCKGVRENQKEYRRSGSFNSSDSYLESSKKEYNSMIKDYRNKVYGQHEEKKKVPKKTKSKLKNKKQAKDEHYELDYVIQVMPIWINKQIFGYLDSSTLQKVKHVNFYWEWLATEAQEQRKVRHYLDENLKTLRNSLNADYDDKPLELREETERVSWRDKRVWQLSRRGAILGKLRKSEKGQEQNYVICTECFNQSLETHLEMFEPRICMPKADFVLTSEPSVSYKDLNLIVVSCKKRKKAYTNVSLLGDSSGSSVETISQLWCN